MKKRRSERYEINVEAVLVYGDSKINGIIENFSDGGLGIRCPYSDSLSSLNTNDTIHIETKILYQETINFPCSVRWTKKYANEEHGSTLRVGVEHLTIKDKQ